MRRCVVLGPVVSFVAAALLLSCGGGSSTTTTSNGLPISLMSIVICAGPPATLTPTPSPTHTKFPTKTPTPTATPSCSPILATSVATPPGANSLLFNVQGQFSQTTKSKKFFNDVTGSCSLIWNVQPPGPLTSNTQCGNPVTVDSGEFLGTSVGCACVTAQIGQLITNTVTVAVGQDNSACTNFCPTPTATPTNTP